MLAFMSEAALHLVTGSVASVFIRQRSETLKNSTLALDLVLVIALVAVRGRKGYTALLLFDRLVTVVIQLVVTVIIGELTKRNFLHFVLRMLQPYWCKLDFALALHICCRLIFIDNCAWLSRESSRRWAPSHIWGRGEPFVFQYLWKLRGVLLHLHSVLVAVSLVLVRWEKLQVSLLDVALSSFDLFNLLHLLISLGLSRLVILVVIHWHCQQMLLDWISLMVLVVLCGLVELIEGLIVVSRCCPCSQAELLHHDHLLSFSEGGRWGVFQSHWINSVLCEVTVFGWC